MHRQMHVSNEKLNDALLISNMFTLYIACTYFQSSVYTFSACYIRKLSTKGIRILFGQVEYAEQEDLVFHKITYPKENQREINKT